MWKKVESSAGALLWDFTKNAELEGGFVRKETNVGPNNSNMYYFKTPTEEVCCWGNTVLDSRLMDAEVGDRIKIVYKGMATSPKTGREYKDFEVFFWDKSSSEEQNEKETEKTDLGF